MISRYILYFALMGFIGWVYETAVMTAWGGRWDNRGFLFGPFLPIYAIGGLGVNLVFAILLPQHTILQVFFIGMLGSAVLEYFTSYVLERIFHRTWWDYSVCPFNLQGRICAPASIGFGIAALVVLYIVNPTLFNLIDRLPTKIDYLLCALYVLCILADLRATYRNLRKGSSTPRLYSRFNDKMDHFVDDHYPTERTPSEIFRDYTERNKE